MNLFNFESILAIVFFVLSVFLFRSTTKRKKQLGNIVIKTLTGLSHSDFLVQTILVIVLAGFTAFSAFYGTSEKNYLLFYIIFPLALIIYYANTIINAFTPKGMYTNGIYTSNGVLFYNEVTEYNMVERPAKNLTKVKINPKSSFFGNSAYLDINPQDEAEIKAYLKRHCAFKKGGSTPPPKRKAPAKKK